jgi:hypothetical protein
MSARMLRPSLGASQAGRCRATGSGPRSRSLNFAGGPKQACRLRSSALSQLTSAFSTISTSIPRKEVWEESVGPGPVDHHIETTGRLDDHGDGPLHGGVICDIDFDGLQGKPFSLREREECFCRMSILARGRTVSLACEGFNCQTTKATGTPSDKNSLLYTHPSFLSRSRHTGPLLVTVEPGL